MRKNDRNQSKKMNKRRRLQGYSMEEQERQTEESIIRNIKQEITKSCQKAIDIRTIRQNWNDIDKESTHMEETYRKMLLLRGLEMDLDFDQLEKYRGDFNEDEMEGYLKYFGQEERKKYQEREEKMNNKFDELFKINMLMQEVKPSKAELDAKKFNRARIIYFQKLWITYKNIIMKLLFFDKYLYCFQITIHGF